MPGGYVVGFDTYAYSGPNLVVTERAYSEWRLPLVNDLIFGGVPHLGNPQAGVLYPPQLLSLVMGTNRTMGVLVAVHLIVLGVGMTLLTRRLGASRVGAAAAGVAAVAVGSSVTKTVQYEQILVVAWAPLLVAAIHAVFTSRRPSQACSMVAVTTAAVLLAGHPQHVYQTVMLAVVAAIGFAVGDDRWRRIPHLAAGVGLGVLIALPQLVAALLATADSAITGGRNEDELASATLSLQGHAVVRALLGTVQDHDPAVFSGGFESIGYLGVVVSLIALIGAIHAVMVRGSRAWAISFLAIAALALVWAMGPGTFVFDVAYDVLPGFDLARSSARWLVIVGLVAALFVGVGTDVLLRGARRHHAAAAAGASLVVALAIAFGPFNVFDRPSAAIWVITAAVVIGLLAVAAQWPGRRVVGVTAVVVLAMAGIELVAMSLHSIPQVLRTSEPFTAHATATTDWLTAQTAGSTIALTDEGLPVEYMAPAFRPNANVLAGVPSLDGYDGGVQITERWAEALRRFTPTPAIELPLRNSLQVPIEAETMARLGVRFVLLDNDRPADVFLPGWVGPRVVDEHFSVWENPAWIGDAVAWPAAMVVEGAPADVLRDDPDGTAGVAIVDDVSATIDCTDGAVRCAPIGLDVERPHPEDLIVETDLDRPTVVSVTQQALPGWSVTVDGEPADEVVVDGLFLGVEVPAGAHTIEWRYHSPWLTLTLVISLLAVVATIALFAFATVKGGGGFKWPGRSADGTSTA